MKAKPKETPLVELVSLVDLKLNPDNPRRNVEGIPKVAASIKRFGFQQPIVAKRDGMILVGHTRYLAAQSLGLKTVPVVWFTGTDEQALAYSIADNRTHEFSGWDTEKLLAQLNEVTRVELPTTGFTPADLKELEDKLKREMRQSQIKELEIPPPPPKRTWVLIAIDTGDYGRIAQHVDAIQTTPGVICEMSVSSEDKAD